MKYLLSFVIFLLSFFIVLSSCTEPTKPPIDNGPDTTSHNFSWTIDTIGIYGSYLKDVAIISGNDIWAVGEIHTDETDRWNEDSTEWIPPFNSVHWDGQTWIPTRIETNYNGRITYPPLEGVFAFSENDIWASSGIPRHWDGKKWTLYHLWDMGILNQSDGGVHKIWGHSSNNLYFVGRKGTIVHYDGQSWQRLESGTDLHIGDIWGAINP